MKVELHILMTLLVVRKDFHMNIKQQLINNYIHDVCMIPSSLNNMLPLKPSR